MFLADEPSSHLSLCDEFRPATGPPPHLTNCRVHYFTSSSSFPSTTHGPPQASSSFFFFLHLRANQVLKMVVRKLHMSICTAGLDH
ncbi:unnamed protein product [Malus baccata var. baccata]